MAVKHCGRFPSLATGWRTHHCHYINAARKMLPGTNRDRDGWARPAPLVGVGVSVFCVELEADSVLLVANAMNLQTRSFVLGCCEFKSGSAEWIYTKYTAMGG